MIFLTGPRQVGKTYFSKSLSLRYFNWDTSEVKRAYLKDPYFFRDQSESNLWVIFDEIHKRRDWKKLLKGFYDSPERRENFLVTGSGRFDRFQKGGDSLQGRYLSYQLFPLVLDEILQSRKGVKPAEPRSWHTWEPEGVPSTKAVEELLHLGGFPAPFLKSEESFLRRWNRDYVDRLVREDIRDLTGIQRLDQLESLVLLLPERASSPISERALSEDLGVSPNTVKSWMLSLESLYLGIYLPPFSKRIHRAIKKERKWYFYQWTMQPDPGSRFENFLAIQLAAALKYWSDQGHGRWELYYLRDQNQREIDFLVACDHKPVALVESKSSPGEWPSSLKYYCEKLKVPGFLIYPSGPTRRTAFGYSLSAAAFLRNLVL